MKKTTMSTAETPEAKLTEIELSGSIAFRSGGRNWGNENRMALLAAIGTEGSITGAARKVGLSYKAAWDAIDGMNNLAGEPWSRALLAANAEVAPRLAPGRTSCCVCTRY